MDQGGSVVVMAIQRVFGPGSKGNHPNGGRAMRRAAPKLAAAGFGAFLFSWGVSVKMEYSFDNKDLGMFGTPRMSSTGQLIEQVLLYKLR